MGFSSGEAWTDVPGRPFTERGLPVLPARAGVERFAWGDRLITLDHSTLALDGLDLPG